MNITLPREQQEWLEAQVEALVQDLDHGRASSCCRPISSSTIICAMRTRSTSFAFSTAAETLLADWCADDRRARPSDTVRVVPRRRSRRLRDPARAARGEWTAASRQCRAGDRGPCLDGTAL